MKDGKAPMHKPKNRFNSKGNIKKDIPLKQKLEKESKIVKIDNLNWKPVEVPDNLDDYEGFYGLEEIDGVDAKVVDGRLEFHVTDDSKIKSEREKAGGEKAEKAEESEEEALEDFKGFDDDNEVQENNGNPLEEENVREHSDEKDIYIKDKGVGSDKVASDEAEEDDNDELKENNFSRFSEILPENDEVVSRWNDLGLSSRVLHAISSLNFKNPTAIQKKAIPYIMKNKDVIGKAITGSGKTLAFGIPIIEKYLQKQLQKDLGEDKATGKAPTGIIFAPTRELAHQVVDHLRQISKFTNLVHHGIVSITGGLSIQKQERLLAGTPGIMVGTPGRFLEIIQNDTDIAERCSRADMIVLDEADRLLQDGHFQEFEKIWDILSRRRPRKDKLLPRKWQTLVFSATFSKDLFGPLNRNSTKAPKNPSKSLLDDREILQLLNEKLQFKDSPIFVDANPSEMVAGKVTEALVECGATERDLYLYYFLLIYTGSTLVFANSIDTVKRLVPLLNNLNISTFAIHSSMVQKQRMRSLERFREANKKNDRAVLVASDVAARGLDIPSIDHVAHYHLPRTADTYVHRSGRTARAGNEGVSVIFCSPQEVSGPLRRLRKLVASSTNSESALNLHGNLDLIPVNVELVNQLRPRIEISARLADAEMNKTAVRKEDEWLSQAADELGVDRSEMAIFEDDVSKKGRKKKDKKVLDKDEVKSLRAELKALLSRLIRGDSKKNYLTSGLNNLAHQIVSGQAHKDVLGHAKENALDVLKSKSTRKRRKI